MHEIHKIYMSMIALLFLIYFPPQQNSAFEFLFIMPFIQLSTQAKKYNKALLIS